MAKKTSGHEFKKGDYEGLRNFVEKNGDSTNQNIMHWHGDERIVLKSGETYSLSEGEEVIRDSRGYSVRKHNGDIVE